MIDGYLLPGKLSGDELDEYLAMGWYRMGNAIFTSHSLPIEGVDYPLFWIRYHLASFRREVMKKSSREIIKKNKCLTVQHKRFSLTGELEDLYARYRPLTTFNAPASVEEFLQPADSAGIFDTQLFEIRDGGKLVAAGIFDNGLESMAGIMNFYDPGYRKYSPGKYLFLLKLLYALEQGKKYFYPGYIAYGHSRFDYKTFASSQSIEFYLPEISAWLTYSPEFLNRIGNISPAGNS